MEYLATKLQPIKSYPTYQFHAFTSGAKHDPDVVFRICVLETLKWLRLRLKQYEVIPPELIAPEPEEYHLFGDERMRSFNINVGAAIDCTYIPGQWVWSLRITEPDIGENIGTDTERLPVNGRTFRTEVSFRKLADNVEVGVRTTCSEPVGCDQPCSVFRPAVVREMANNPDVGFVIDGFRLNGKPLVVSNQTELKNLERLLSSEEFDMPVAIIADSGYEDNCPVDILLPDKHKLSFKGFGNTDFTAGLTADTSKVEIKNSAIKTVKDDSEKACTKNEPLPDKPENTKLKVLDYEHLAERVMGFAVVAFVTKNCFAMLRNKLGINISENEVIIFDNKKEAERLHYTDKNIESIYSKLKKELRDMLRRSIFTYGSILFYSDARLTDLSERQSENLSLEDKLKICIQENSELKAGNRELSQQNTDLRLNIENIRLLHKQIKSLSDENAAQKIYIENAETKYKLRENAYRNAANLVSFYRQKSADAAYFPTNKDDVCSWAKREFAENIVITPQAESALRKYSAAFDVPILCDGLYFLNAYAKYRRSEITENELSLYAESYNWEVSGCGSGALRTHRDDYEILYEGRKLLMDMHIKYGVNSQVLVRVYFCRDNKSGKIIIGYMPGHLSTAKQST